MRRPVMLCHVVCVETAAVIFFGQSEAVCVVFRQINAGVIEVFEHTTPDLLHAADPGRSHG